MTKIQILSYILFILGVFITIAAFLISNAEKILWVGKILFPTYYRAKRALDKIDANEILNRGDPGFEEIEKIVKSHLVTVPQNKGKEKIIQASDLIKLGHPMGVALFGPGQFDSNLGVKMQYQSHEIDFDDFDYNVVKNGVAALQSNIIFKGNIWVIVLGIVLVIASKAVDILASK